MMSVNGVMSFSNLLAAATQALLYNLAIRCLSIKLEVAWLQLLKYTIRIVLPRDSVQLSYIRGSVPGDNRLVKAAVRHVHVVIVRSKLLGLGNASTKLILCRLQDGLVVLLLGPGHIEESMKIWSVFGVEAERITTLLLHGT